MSLILFALLVVGWRYVVGVRRLWRAAGRGRGIRTWQADAFLAGLVAVAVALVSPLDTMADLLFSVHMAQHLVLIGIAAPLLALGGGQIAFLWSIPRSLRVLMGRLNRRAGWLHIVWVLPVAFGFHSLALWVWHTPALYEGALHNGALHALEHLALLGTGFLFWSAAWPRRTFGAGVLYVFAFGAQCTGLGALITLSNHPWYSSYASGALGLNAMDDQVLAGALMWVPAGMLYLVYALVLLGSWLQPVSRAEPGPLLQRRAHLPGAAPPHQTTPAE